MMIEAMFIAMMLALSLAVIESLRSAPPSIANIEARNVLELGAGDALRAMDIVTDKDYGTKLQRFLVECFNGETANFTAFLKKVFPVGADYALRVRQGGASVEACPPRGPVARETVGASLVFWPWVQDAAFVVPEYLNYDALEMGMDVTVIPMRNGYPEEAERDLELVVEVELGGVIYNQTHRLVLQPGPHVTMGLVDGAQVGGYYGNTNVDQFTLRVTEHAGVAVPQGTRLLLTLPGSWRDVNIDNATTGWDDFSVQNLTVNGWAVSATTQAALSGGSFDFKFNGSRPVALDEGAASFHVIHAGLGDEPLATSTLVFRGNKATQSLAGAFTRGAVLDLPRRAAPGSEAQWSIVIADPDPNPSTFGIDGGCLSNCQALTRITIRQPENLALFQSVTGGGWSTGTTPGTPSPALTWAGTNSIGADQAVELRFTVALNDTAQGGLPYDAQRRVTFQPSGAGVFNLTTMPFPGADHERIGTLTNVTNGYPSTGLGLGVCSDHRIDARLHRGCASYGVRRTSAFLDAREAVAKGSAASTVNVLNTTHLRPGDWLTVHANFTALDQQLAPWPAYASTARTVVTMYHPWMKRNASAVADHVAYWHLAATPGSPGDTVASLRIPEGVVFGTYVVVAERMFNLTANVGAGEFVFNDTNTDQSVRKVTWVTVGDKPGLERTFMHTISLLVWMPDWQ